MLSLVISCTLLKGIKHQFTLCALIIRRTSRLFICETNKEGRSYLLELDEHQVAIKHVYHGLWKRSVGVVPFDTMKIQFLAIGDAFKIKFWDMDNSYLLTTTAAEGGLPAAPCIRFNKEGIAVSTSENGIKILANADGVWLLRCIENQAVGTSRVAPATIEKPQAQSVLNY
ncbi:protein TPR3-like isoform X4 [Quercus lobata]|uniref:protein TPR3-like isoform X4 n=1 Tax=Quercus lobata TaxID=97700 RepID=UPI001249154B|nr:protein TPR3-like isoform X4 [Quercus lobata]